MKDLFPAYQRVVVEKLRVALQKHLSMEGLHFSRNHMDVACYLDEASRQLVVAVETYLLGKKHAKDVVTERVPADWWQAVRERWCPFWWLRRFPVRYREIVVKGEVWNVCPHVNQVARPEQRHVEFLMAAPSEDVWGEVFG